MEKRNLPKSLRKYIRREKARIRRIFWEPEKQEELIKKLYLRILGDKNEDSRNSQSGGK